MNILLQFLYERMSEFPNSFISDGYEKITYEELVHFAESHYQYLSNKKYGIVCKGAINTIKSIFCCLFSNSTAVVMSDKYGQTHINKIIKKTQLSYLICDDGIKKIAIESEEKDDLTDVAFLMCTSGTTGEPKAAMITYHNILCNIKDIEKYFKMNNRDTILITRPLCHASALVGELFAAMICGANIIVNNTTFNPFMTNKILHTEEITVFCATPTVCYQVANIGSRNQENNYLRKIAISGECMTRTVADKLLEVYQDTELYNVYGLTEASPRVSYLTPELFRKKPESVGISLDSVKVKIIDDELYVKGNNVMKGYYGERMLTDKIIQNGWLKTGDVAYIDSDGLLYIKGRKDDLIIRAGINIYPQEIESSLLHDRKIIDVVAFRIPNNIAGDRIGIKVVSKCINEKEIFAICKKNLPSYQMPDYIECVDQIEKNGCGKTVRKNI